MFRVIDTIRHSESWLRHYPEKMERYGEGLMAILDPQQTSGGFDEEATEAEVIVDGVVQRRLAIDLIEKNPRGVVGVFFRGAPEHAVARGATLRLTRN